MTEDAIAIVGLAGRFPGAADVGAFWQNLCAGRETISRFEEAELEDAFPPEVRANPRFVRARPILEGVDLFDAGFFGIQANEAALIDPQHRVFLECCWEALEDAGHDPAAYPGAIGVVAGCSINTYVMHHVLRDRSVIETFTSEYQVGSYPMLLGAGQDFLATRVAYKLDLRGPALTVQSACSTSLLAVTQACQSLLMYQADMMLAGGVSISLPQKRGYLYQDGGMVSRDGHCRSFDIKADGTVFGAGAGVVALKRLEDAVADGNTIYAVIRGFGVNNDGARKVGYTAPSVDGQAAAIAAAHAMAGVDPRMIRYVECHGTATPLGDPIEFAGLRQAFGDAAMGQYCAIGSVKSNVGHLDIAAGITGLIKTALMIRHGRIPPTLHFTAPNPAIDLAASPFFVNTQLAAWPDDAKRVAGVSAFGVGGTNVHVLLEEAPPPPAVVPNLQPQLLVLSARSAAALGTARTRLAAHLQATPAARLADIAHTLRVGRRAFPQRWAFTAATPAEAIEHLRRDGPAAAEYAADAARIAFMFPGQGAQYAGMARGLYEGVEVFRDAIDLCATLLQPMLGRDLRELLAADDAALAQTAVAQPAIFAVSYALAQTWLAWGVTPAVMVGHSVGEFVAACLAEVFSLGDALALVAARGRLMQALPGGAMLAVRLAEADITPLLAPPLGLAAINAPTLCVVAGPDAAVAELARDLDQRSIACRRLNTSHAFHSPMMDAAVAPLAELIGQMRLSPPTRRYVSTVSGTWITAAEATSAAYWAQHCRAPVRFADAVATLAADGATALLEVGPGAALATFARQAPGLRAGCTIASSLPGTSRETGDLAPMLAALGRLWIAGVAPDWAALPGAAQGRLVPLPTYPFERTRHWIDAPPVRATQAAPALPPASTMDPTPMPDQTMPAAAHTAGLQQRIITLLQDLSGEDLEGADVKASFLELGFDSLFLGQFVQQVQARIGITVTFRQLLGELPSIAALAAHAAATLPPQAAPAATPVPPAAASGIESIMRDQLQAMQTLIQQQLQVLQGGAPIPAPVAKPEAPAPSEDPPSRLKVYQAGGSQAKAEVTKAQQAHIAALVARTIARTGASRQLTQKHRAVLADPRAAAGFRAEWKEMVYPIVAARAKGARIWDIDGNEYIDVVNGYGQTAFGHAPDFVVDAVADQLHQGFAIGPQSPVAGEVAALFSELTGNERVTFCNTGSEAVMAALRIARTVTGRQRVVMFGGSYHGQFDEVLVKGGRTAGRALPAAPGIPPESVANMVVLPYATPDSLEWVRAHANELAAVVVEPVQSRHPGLQPKEFLHALRRITEASGTAFVMDEVVTGFRMHPGGMQAAFGVRADLATYGKVVGGGLPIGILAGCRRFMDALDGGMWQYGDDSYPEVAPTFFAGTFVRHPLVMAATLAVLRHLQAEGPALQVQLSARTAGLVARLNADFARRGFTTRIESYGSLFYFSLAGEHRLAGLLYYHLRARGIYIQEGFPCFLTTQHSADDLDTIGTAFADSLDALAAAGILAGAAPAGPIPPTEQQTEIWLSAQLGDAASCAFNESITLRMEGALDEAALQAAWTAVIARHDALRASFSATGEAIRFAPPGPFSYPTTDLAGGPGALAALVEQDARTPFDLIEGPLLRGQLLRLGPTSHAFILTAHHIVCDGWSINVLLGELATLYAGGALPAALAFSAYASRPPDAAARARMEAFWTGQFQAPLPPLDLPTDRPRPALKTSSGATCSRRIEVNDYQAIRRAGARQGCTLFAVLLAGFQALMGRLADRTDVTVGVPTAGQSLLEDQILVGHCVNFLPIRGVWTAQTSLADLLKATKRRVLDAYEHQDYTLGTLVRALQLERSVNRLPLTEIQFNLERLSDGLAFPGLEVTVEPNPKSFVNFDLFLNIIESADGLRLDCDYNTDLFDAATIDRWLGYYATLLAALAADATQPVVTVDYAAERPATPAPGAGTSGCVHRLIEAQAAARPEAIAARFEATELSYAALDRRANQLAHALCRHAAPGALVGICLPRSQDMLVALLATWKAGCAYVPLDPGHPPARLRQVLDDAGIAVLLTTGSPAAGIPTIDLSDLAAGIAAEPLTPPARAASADDLAYVIYTSGSTGRPKGVEITQGAVVNLLASMARAPGMTAEDVLVAVTTVAFDIAALELFLPLTLGATVVIADAETAADGFRLLSLVETSGATVMQATPATWRLLLEAGFRRPGLRMLCGGEALPAELAARLLEAGGELWNMYGPTETTIWSSCARITDATQPITIGRPIDATQLYVLDSHDQQVPAGVTGQLHIGGAGVARGYVGRPDLTAASFVADPFNPGRMYRTGDLARVRPDGAVQLLGRMDQQVKLRGFRIELGEIEAVLARQAGVTAAAVARREDLPGGAQLVGYYTAADAAAPSPADLRAGLAEALPEYMIPAIWVRLAALPLSANGKLDRAALPAPGEAAPRTITAPTTPMEQALAAIWAEVLQRDLVGTEDDLFELGADSIHLFQITARAHRQGIRLAARQLMQHRTIAALAAHLDQAADTGAPAAPRMSSLARFPQARPLYVVGKRTGSDA